MLLWLLARAPLTFRRISFVSALSCEAFSVHSAQFTGQLPLVSLKMEWHSPQRCWPVSGTAQLSQPVIRHSIGPRPRFLETLG